MRIVVTGFGPFGGYSTNPSTVVVNKLGDKFSSDLQIELITKTLDVDYLEALEYSKWICEELKADFVIHVGVQPTPGKLLLETCSFSDGYICPDVRGSVPLMNRCEAGSMGQPTTLMTSLNCELLRTRVLKQVFDEENIPIQIEISNDPGRYLCGYIYYCSLQNSKCRCLFIHIPPFDKECTPDILTKILRQIVIELHEIIKTESAL